MKKAIASQWAKRHLANSEKWKKYPVQSQEKCFQNLLKVGKNTEFGFDYLFSSMTSIKDFQEKVPIRDYEDFKPYIAQIINGEEDVLWKGRPAYFAKTSGTTSGAKYIPISQESLKYQLASARSALLHYIARKNAHFVNGKMIFLQGSPVLSDTNGIPTGRLSGIVAHKVPSYLQKNRLPSWKTNCIEDWETKVEAIVRETMHENMTLISGIPPWLIMYFERLLEATSLKSIKELFPNLQLIVTGGVNYEPYRAKMNELLGGKVDILQTFPASEGFFAFQDEEESKGMLLLLNHGIFYEFVPLEEIGQENPKRLTIKDVELDKDYVMIISTNAGLWAYNIGDTVRFVNKNPYRVVVSGRVKHYTSAFGEHVIAHEVETALQQTLEKYKAEVVEFTLAPQVNPKEGLPYHEWLIEFSEPPAHWEEFSQELDNNLRKQNSYYDDLIEGKILEPLHITPIKKEGFVTYMKSQGKLGGQNKVPRLSNDRKIADEMYRLQLIRK